MVDRAKFQLVWLYKKTLTKKQKSLSFFYLKKLKKTFLILTAMTIARLFCHVGSSIFYIVDIEQDLLGAPMLTRLNN